MEKMKTCLMVVLSAIGGNTDFTAANSVVAVVGGFIVARLGGADPLLKALGIAVVIDYLVGVVGAIIHKEVSSSIGAKGIGKKVLYFLIVGLAFLIQEVTGGAVQLREIAIMFYLCNEAISILENVVEAGVPVPSKLKEVLIQLKGQE